MTSSPACSRRAFLQRTAAFAAAATFVGPLVPPAARSAEGPRPTAQPTPQEALRVLLEGNKRFAAGQLKHPRRQPEDFRRLAEEQHPIAVVVGCSDARVPPEVLFDQGVGDLFVIRVAGNVIRGSGPVVSGSVEYAVAELHVPLVVVLGHSGCGAVKAALKYKDPDELPFSLGELIDSIQPAVEDARAEQGDLLENAIRANVRRGIHRLKTRAAFVGDAIQQGRLQVVGATYDLRDGRVTLLDQA
jgi:carbonic anhydrase